MINTPFLCFRVIIPVLRKTKLNLNLKFKNQGQIEGVLIVVGKKEQHVAFHVDNIEGIKRVVLKNAGWVLSLCQIFLEE